MFPQLQECETPIANNEDVLIRYVRKLLAHEGISSALLHTYFLDIQENYVFNEEIFSLFIPDKKIAIEYLSQPLGFHNKTTIKSLTVNYLHKFCETHSNNYQ